MRGDKDKSFESKEEDSDRSRAIFAECALDKLRFCYKKADGDDEQVSLFLAFTTTVYVHINTTQRRTFGDFIKVPLLFKLSVNTSLRSRALGIFLGFVMKMKGHAGLSHYQSQRYVIIFAPTKILIMHVG